MIIAAFDLATQTGVAVGDSRGDPKCWSERIGWTGEPHGSRFAACMTLVDTVIRDYDVDLIAVEKPITGKRESSAIPFMLIGLRACLLGVARIRGVPSVEFDVRTVRASFLGSGMGTLPSREAKTAVMAGCRLRGWTVIDDNAADAAALWDYTRGIRNQAGPTNLEAWAEKENSRAAIPK